MTLKQELEDVERIADPSTRGKRFESFLAHLLAEDGFKVNEDPKTAIPHQTDLSAARDQLYFLVEAKWLGKAAHLSHISAVRERLRTTSPDIFACVFSMSGFSEGAIEELAGDRSGEIFWFKEEEIRGMAAGDLSFSELLNIKREVFRTHASAWFQVWIPADHSTHLRSKEDVIRYGEALFPWMLSQTGDADVLFSNEGLDITGKYGEAVFSLDLMLNMESADDFQRILDQARKHLGLKYDGSFAIHQRNAGWFGFGAGNFLKAIESQASRYSALGWKTYHHSEELAYVDRIETGGLICFSSRQDTRGGSLHSSRAEIFLPGIPVEMSGIRRFCDFVRQSEASFEIVSQNPTKTLRFHPWVKAEPIAAIISTSRDQEFVSGVVVKNPFLNQPLSFAKDPEKGPKYDDLFWLLSKYELLFCALRNWHNPNALMNNYRIFLAEGCWIEHVPAFYILCDWDDES